MAPKRTSRGKQKREMKKIERKSDLLVAFTKRKFDIYNKAFELSTLCGALVDILMISPAGKPYCYGKSSSQSIATTIMKDKNPSVEEELKKLKINEVNTKNDELLDKKHVAEAQRENLKALESYGYWLINEEDVESFDYDQLQKLDTSLVDIANKLISSVLSNGGEINPHGTCTSSNQLGLIFDILMMSIDFISCFLSNLFKKKWL